MSKYKSINSGFLKIIFVFLILCIVGTIMFSGCLNQEPEPIVETGDTVTVEVVGKYENGTVFHNATGAKVLTFKVGSATQISGLEDEVIGLKQNESKTFSINLPYSQGKVITYPKEFVEQSGIEDLEVGSQVAISSTIGLQFGTVKTIYENGSVDVDFNDPLAGEKLIFDIKLIEFTKEE